MGRTEQARQYAEELLALLNSCKPEGFADPELVYWRGYEVMMALEDERATDILALGHLWLQEQLSLIINPDEQQLFLENVPAIAHLQTAAAWQPEPSRMLA
jgi:hypothetical protein